MSENTYTGCPVQHARQFIAGKWQIGILWNLRDKPCRFSEIKSQLPEISDKILMQELDFFVEKKIVERIPDEFSLARAEYTLTREGQSLMPVINSIVEWGYLHLQNERISKDMNETPIPAILAIEEQVAGLE